MAQPYYDDDDCDDHHRIARDCLPDCRELAENAKSLTGPAGYAMLAAFVTSVVKIVGNVVINITEPNIELGQGPVEAILISCCHVLLFTPMVACIGIGARMLFTLGPRGLIVAAIVMNFIYFLLGGCGWASNIVLLGSPAQGFADGTALGLSTLSGLANLVAAIMTIRVMTFREVSDAYNARDEAQRYS